MLRCARIIGGEHYILRASRAIRQAFSTGGNFLESQQGPITKIHLLGKHKQEGGKLADLLDPLEFRQTTGGGGRHEGIS